MGTHFLPSTDAGLLRWSLNFKTLITASPTDYGLTAGLATTYGGLHDAYATAFAACDPAIRTKGSVATKNEARANLKDNARLLSKLVEGTASVTNEQKIDLGLNVRAMPSPIPVPDSAPGLDVLSVTGWTVKIRLHDTESTAKRGKPPGVSGATVFSYVGATPPTNTNDWQFEGSTGRSSIDVIFPDTVAGGTRVWLAAFWFNGRKQSGAACDPVPVTLQGGALAVSAAA